MGEVRVGLSGWRYREWRGRFYPPGLVQRRELEYVAERFDTVEINGSFYSLQRPSSYQAWAATVPPGFVFAVKGGRYITHLLKLRNVEAPVANFFASGPLALGPALGPVLWQLPPRLTFDEPRLEAFLEMLPRTTSEAVQVARGHDARLADRTWLTTDADRPLHHALEVRDDSFRDPAFLRLLERQGVSVVVADTAGRWPMILDPTARLVYVRLHGDVELYTSGYSDAALDLWAERVRAWEADGHDVVVYFDNDVDAHAPADAAGLALRLGVGPLSATR